MDYIKKEMIYLGKSVKTKEEAIRLCGELLVEAGCVEKDYVSSMLEREKLVSTYMGNFLAIPHGTEEGKRHIKKTGLSFVQIPEGVDFGEDGEENLVMIMFGISGIGDEHIDVLSKIAVFCSDIENVLKLVEAKTEYEVLTLIGGLN